MHPILSRGRVGLYLAAWIPVGGLLASLAVVGGRRSVLEALGLTLPLALVYAFICLGSWSLCRALPLDRTGFPTLAFSHAAGAVVSCALWLIFGRGWAAALGRIASDPGIESRYTGDLPLFFAAGTLLFLLSAVVHYLLIAFEASREAERRALELQVLAREAQLRALTAQVNPHFLFNSLNSISALAGSDSAGARRMCLLLADFLRKTLALRERDEIPLGDEIALVDAFLAVEQVRFGNRLRVEQRIDPATELCLVPPLVLQPLVENAVSHGIAGLVEGGTILIEARQAAGRLELTIVNPADPDRPRKRGHGVGLKNVRDRLATRHGGAAHVDAREENGTFTVALSLPAQETSPIEQVAAAPSSAASPSASADADADAVPGRAGAAESPGRS
jgi:two-component system sensor histidine kinase AlgZ